MNPDKLSQLIEEAQRQEVESPQREVSPEEETWLQWVDDMLFFWDRVEVATVEYYRAYWHVDVEEDLLAFLLELGYPLDDMRDGKGGLSNVKVLPKRKQFEDLSEKEWRGITDRLANYPSLGEATDVALEGLTKEEASERVKEAAARKPWSLSYQRIYYGDLDVAVRFIRTLVDKEDLFPVSYVEGILKSRKIYISIEKFVEKAGLKIVEDAIEMMDGSKKAGVTWTTGIEATKALLEGKE